MLFRFFNSDTDLAFYLCLYRSLDDNDILNAEKEIDDDELSVSDANTTVQSVPN